MLIVLHAAVKSHVLVKASTSASQIVSVSSVASASEIVSASKSTSVSSIASASNIAVAIKSRVRAILLTKSFSISTYKASLLQLVCDTVLVKERLGYQYMAKDIWSWRTTRVSSKYDETVVYFHGKHYT